MANWTFDNPELSLPHLMQGGQAEDGQTRVSVVAAGVSYNASTSALHPAAANKFSNSPATYDAFGPNEVTAPPVSTDTSALLPGWLDDIDPAVLQSVNWDDLPFQTNDGANPIRSYGPIPTCSYSPIGFVPSSTNPSQPYVNSTYPYPPPWSHEA